MRTGTRVLGLLAALTVAIGVVALGPSPTASAGTASISGTVSLGSAATPAGAGEVRVYYRADGQALDESRSVLTDAAGGYALAALNAGMYALYFDYVGTEGFSDTWWAQAATLSEPGQFFNVPTHSTAVTGLNQVLGAPGAIAGTVSLAGTTDLPAAGEVLVSYAAKTGFYSMAAESTPVPVSDGGSYLLPNLPNGEYALHFSYAGTGPFQSVWAGGSYELNSSAVLTVAAGTTTTRNQAQPRLSTISGQITVGDHLAVAGAFRVELEQRINWVWSPVPGGTLISGADGRYSMSGLINVPYRATLTYLRTDGHSVPTATIPEGSGFFASGQLPNSHWSTTVTPAVNISGTIYLGDYETTSTAGEASVEYRLGTTLVKSALTTAGGGFEITGLPVLDRATSAIYGVTIRYLGTGNYPDRQWTSKPTHDEAPRILLDSTAAFTGHVTLGSNEVTMFNEVIVRAGGRETVTDEHGNYRLAGMNNGFYKVQFVYAGYDNYTDEWWPHAPINEFAEYVYVDGNGTVLDVNLSKGGSISGHITTPTGVPPYSMLVHAVSYIPAGPSEPAGSPAHRIVALAGTDVLGNYSFRNLRPGQYSIEFNPGHGPMWGGSAASPGGTTINVAAGDEITGIDALLYGGTITGQATCATCGPGALNWAQSRFRVDALDPVTGLWKAIGNGNLYGPDPYFSFEARYPGTYRVYASYSFEGGPSGSGYSSPVVVNGGDVTTTVAMSPKVRGESVLRSLSTCPQSTPTPVTVFKVRCRVAAASSRPLASADTVEPGTSLTAESHGLNVRPPHRYDDGHGHGRRSGAPRE